MADSPNLQSVDLYSVFEPAADDLVENGKWFWLVPNVQGFKLRGITSQAVSDLRDKLTAPYENLVKVAGAEALSDEVKEDIGYRVLAGAVVVDWKGIKNKAGEEVPFSEAEAYTILRDLKRLADYISAQSTDLSLFKKELTEAAAGN